MSTRRAIPLHISLIDHSPRVKEIGTDVQILLRMEGVLLTTRIICCAKRADRIVTNGNLM